MFAIKHLMEHHLYLNNIEKIKKYVELVITDATKPFDMVKHIVSILLLYQQTALAKKIIDAKYVEFNTYSHNWKGLKEQIILVQVFEEYQRTGQLQESILLEANYTSVNYDGLYQNIQDAFRTDVAVSIKTPHPILCIKFQWWAYQKGIPIVLSAIIFTKALAYCDANLSKTINKDKYLEHCFNVANFMEITDWTLFKGVTAFYFYEFLAEVNIIKDLPIRIKVLEQVRQHLLNAPLVDNLWFASYLFLLPKPDSISAEEWEASKAVVRGRYNNQMDISTLSDEERERMWASYYNNDVVFSKNTKKELPNIDRNKVVKVRYKDGSEKEGKFKKLQKDLEDEKCELI
jgi:hypothetical protein